MSSMDYHHRENDDTSLVGFFIGFAIIALALIFVFLAHQFHTDNIERHNECKSLARYTNATDSTTSTTNCQLVIKGKIVNFSI